MRIAVSPCDEGGCGNYRLRFPAQALIAQGADVVLPGTVGPKTIWRDWADYDLDTGEVLREYKTLLKLKEPFPYDVWVIQRPERRWMADVIPHLQASGTKVVVDVDDLVDSLHHSHVGRQNYDPRLVDWHNHEWVDEACKLADLVTCTTPALLKRYGHGHGRILPNLVPERYLSIVAEKRPKTVGWTGHAGTHPGDLESTEGAIRAIPNDWSVHVIGTGNGVREGLGYRGSMTATEWVPIDEYPQRYAELDLAIVPLANTSFNAAKSALKAMEASSLGVPVVMSPTPDNVRMHKSGVGVLAASPGQWRRQLRRLTRDDRDRAELAEQGRAAMRTWTYERNAHKWYEAWSSVVNQRKVA